MAGSWVDRVIGKAVSMEGANISAITFNVVTGVPEPDDDSKSEAMRLAAGLKELLGRR